MTRTEVSDLKKHFELKELELNALLEITQSINNNLPRESLYKIFNFTLRANLKLKKLALYVYDEFWACKVNFGTRNNFFKISPTDSILLADGISNLEGLDQNDPFSEFEKVIPVKHKGNLLGVVLLGGYDLDDYRNGEINLNFIEALSNIIIVAVENKKLARKELEQKTFQKELEIARNVQHFLFPKKLPNNERIKLHSSYLPHQKVGGDYFDYIPVNDDQFLICIADVSGKGIPAALLMSNFQASLRTIVRQTTKFEKIIRELNYQILQNSNGESFITFFAALYNKTEKYFKYVNAGHIPPIFDSEKTGLTQLEKGTTVLGILDTLPFLNVGKIRNIDKFFFFAFTDGLIETFDEEDEPFGSERILEIIKDHKDMDLKNLHRIVIDEVTEFKGTRDFNDDITLFSCRINFS
ncbi:MAG: PP2C family protein-serine/threonine phosphatase [Cyclobacteriaceae bacterium]|nr:PP2C family protein-serine/threonine phosphatase [Cyclobacteriaceae bacterium]